jgi:hypothetical protein
MTLMNNNANQVFGSLSIVYRGLEALVQDISAGQRDESQQFVLHSLISFWFETNYTTRWTVI